MTRDEHIKRLSRICVRDRRWAAARGLSEPFAIGRWWSGATDGCAIVVVKRYLGLRAAPRTAYPYLANKIVGTKRPRRAWGCDGKRFRAWVRSTAMDNGSDVTPVSIAGATVNRKLVARALSAAPMTDGRVWLWRMGRGDLDPLVIDGDGWRAVIMPLRELAPRSRWGKPLLGEERAA